MCIRAKNIIQSKLDLNRKPCYLSNYHVFIFVKLMAMYSILQISLHCLCDTFLFFELPNEHCISVKTFSQFSISFSSCPMNIIFLLNFFLNSCLCNIVFIFCRSYKIIIPYYSGASDVLVTIRSIIPDHVCECQIPVYSRFAKEISKSFC